MATIRQVMLLSCLAVVGIVGCAPEPPSSVEQPHFFVEPLVERTVDQLPQGPLYWRVETFPSIAAARSATGPLSLAAEMRGKAWLFTLAPAGGKTEDGTTVAEIGPVPIVPAPKYLLRINRAGGPPGASTPIHSHPGSEVFHVLSGQLTQKTAHGDIRLNAGQSMNGHGAGMAMQLTSSGDGDLEQLVMFVVDATQPFSSPAALP